MVGHMDSAVAVAVVLVHSRRRLVVVVAVVP